ncbi:MAG: DUF86 domain-containing protein [Clostridia bacterium]|nr:DUF86 domain-containing protein [Clostridia bacterium]
MRSKDRIIIQKIIGYIEDIEKYVYNMEAIDFLDDKKTITACAFTVSQIGELVKEIDEETIERYHSIPWNSIKGMRNRIVHDYENVDLAVLWGTIKESLPQLKKELKELIINDIDNCSARIIVSRKFFNNKVKLKRAKFGFLFCLIGNQMIF